MKKLLSYIKLYKKEAILGPLFKLLEASFELIIPLVVAKIIDDGIKNQSIGTIIPLFLLMVLLGIVGLLCSVTAQYFSAKAAVGMSSDIRSDVFKKLQSLSYSEIDDLGTSKMVTILTNDINQVQNGVNLTLRLFLRSPFIVFGAMIMAFTININAAIIFAISIPILAVIVFVIMLCTMPLYKRVQEKLDVVLRKTRENLSGVRVVRAFSREDEEVKEFDVLNNDLRKRQSFVGSISGLMNPLTYAVVNSAIILILWIGAKEVDSGVILQGEVIALYNYMSQILVELIKLANLIITMSKAVACGNRIEDVLEMESSLEVIKDNKRNKYSFIEFNNVCLAYKKSNVESLTNISFKVEKGETIGIIGGTGSGKSSLVNLIPHFYDTTNGTLLFDGKNVKSYNNKELRDRIGVVPQKAVLFKGTIKSNLLWGNETASDEELNEALKLSEAFEIVDKKERKLDSVVEQNGRNFSGGQKQRLTIARALVRKPEVLILDDSASALDYKTESNLRSNLKNLGYDPTIFIVSQRTSSIKHADKIIVLENGEMVGLGKHDELIRTCDVYKEIHYSQYKKEENNEKDFDF